MSLCLCRRHLLLGAGGLLATPAKAQGASHAALHAALRSANAYDPYVIQPVREIVGALASAMRVPGGAAVNAVPGPNGIMVVIMRTESERPADTGGFAIPRGVSGSPVSDPERGVVWVDSDYLRRLVTQISLMMGSSFNGAGLGSAKAVAHTMLTPLAQLAAWWREGESPALTHPTLGLISRGAGGFVLAHEMAHVLQGAPPPIAPAQVDLPSRARQLAPMCPELTDPTVMARRDYESAADAVALRAVLAGGAALGRGPVGLPGELGIQTLLLLLLAGDMLRIGTTVERPTIHRMVEMQIGAELFERLRAPAAVRRPGTDMMGMLYTDLHPAAVQRLRIVERTLSSLPQSQSYGQQEEVTMTLMMRLIEQECENTMRGLPPR